MIWRNKYFYNFLSINRLIGNEISHWLKWLMILLYQVSIISVLFSLPVLNLINAHYLTQIYGYFKWHVNYIYYHMGAKLVIRIKYYIEGQLTYSKVRLTYPQVRLGNSINPALPLLYYLHHLWTTIHCNYLASIRYRQ